MQLVRLQSPMPVGRNCRVMATNTGGRVLLVRFRMACSISRSLQAGVKGASNFNRANRLTVYKAKWCSEKAIEY